MKVGDLVTFDEDPDWDDLARRLGIIVSFDEDDDPIIIWSDKSSKFTNRTSKFNMEQCNS